MEKIRSFFQFSFSIGDAKMSVGSFLVLVIIIIALYFTMRFVRRLLTRKLSEERKGKFKPVFSFFNYLLYTVIAVSYTHLTLPTNA